MKISTFLMQDMVIPQLASESGEEALREMVDFLKKKNIISRDKEIFERLIQRENLGSTGIGDGVAIPHCKVKEVKNPTILLSISKKGIDFHSFDGKPTHVFFLVVSAPDNPSLSLQILAAIAHLVRKAHPLKKKILNADNISTILRIVREEEERTDE